jgi:excisionase family DNA binding protein
MDMNDKIEPPADGDTIAGLLSVPEAAARLRVSPSTVWRWIDQGLLPAYRVGRKRVYLRPADLAPLLRPAREKSDGISEEDRKRLRLVPMNPDRRTDVDPVALAKALHAKQRAKYRGKGPQREAWEDINEMRDERSRELE